MVDFSNYPKDSNYCNTNNLVVDKKKDEKCDMPITSFVGLKGNHKFKKAKDNNVDDELKYEDYKNV